MSRLLHIIMTVAVAVLPAACGGGDIQIMRQTDAEALIYPDYRDVTIPCNIAPMNFNVSSGNEARVIVRGDDGTMFQLDVRGDDGEVDIPMKRWKQLLAGNKGGRIEFTVAELKDGQWTGYKPFGMYVAEDSIDPYVAYRLLPPYEQWLVMGIYQRNLETFDETAIYENRLTDYNCVNCHSFPAQNPDKMLFHMRAKDAYGTVLVRNGRVQKVNTKTGDMIANLVYPNWSSDGRYVAASTNIFYQSYFYNNRNQHVEVYDVDSDVYVYDTDKDELLTCDALSSKAAFETFPAFSPDGRTLYFCTTQAVDSVSENIDKIRYSLCSIGFDPETRTFGTQVDTLFNADKDGRSINFPRLSPDGRQMVVTLMDFGNFSINKKEADLYRLDLTTGSVSPIDAINSPDTESYHSWSSNSRWMVFSSRRQDGLYTRPYFTYVGEDGTFHKPFLMPQRNPAKYYREQMNAYNIPEMIRGKVNVNEHDIATTLRDGAGTNLTIRKQQ